MTKKQRALLIVNKLQKLFPEQKTALNSSNSWELLVAVILSAQCTDKKVNEVTSKLFHKYRTLNDYINANLSEFEKDIRPTGFYKNKAKNILNSAKMVKDKFNGKVPDNLVDLIKLSGVARKTANVVLYNAFGKAEGIAVDTHMIRIMNKLGLTSNNNPEKIEKDLMKVIPKKYWGIISNQIAEYGRKYCPAKKHNHEMCPLTQFSRV